MESQGIFRSVQTVLARFWSLRYGTRCQLCGSVAWGLIKGTMASACLSVWKKTFPVSRALLVSFKLIRWCWSSEGVNQNKSVSGFFKGNFLGLQNFFYWLNPHCILQPEVVGTYLPGTGILGCGAWCGAGTPHSQYVPPEFLYTTLGCGTSLFRISTHPTILGGCGFFIP